MTETESKWWDRLAEHAWVSRLIINDHQNKDFLALLKLVLIATALIGVSVVVSFLQLIYVADKLIGIWAVIISVLFGMLAGVSLSNCRTEEVFEAVATSQNHKVILKNGVTVSYNKAENRTVWSTRNVP